MATNNAINLTAFGIVVYDANGNFTGRTLQSSTPSTLTITNPDGASGNPTLAVTGVLSWTDVTGTTQAMSVSNGYIADNASLVTFTLPATAALGDQIQVWGKAAGGWKISQNAGQQIIVGILSSTAGTGGFVASTKQTDIIQLRCTTAGASTIWSSIPSGNVTVA